jgi:hypothetical protein
MFFKHFIRKYGPFPATLYENPFVPKAISVPYMFLWRHAEDALVRWHKEELVRLHPLSAVIDGQSRLIAAREVARAAGIRPGDPRYPTLRDVVPRRSNPSRSSQY